MLALASCSSEEALTARQDAAEKQAVAIRPLIQNNTRGESVNLANLKEFGVIAKGEGLDGGAWKDNVTDGGDGSSWNTNSVHYWTTDASKENSTASFTGFYPTTLNVTTASTDVALDFSALTNGNDQVDHLVAFNTGTKASNADNGVALNFKHVLSQIVIQAANKNTEERKIEIVGVKIASVKSKNTLVLPVVPTNGTSTYTPYSTAANTPMDMIVKGKTSNAITLTNTAQNIMFESGGMVLPQDLAGVAGTTLASTDTYISVLCRVYKADATAADGWKLIYPYVADGATDSGAFAFSSVGISGTWEPGKKYTYTLNFYQGNDGGAGTPDPDYTEPATPDNPNPVDPDSPNPDDPTDPDEPVQPTPDPTNPQPPVEDPTDPETDPEADTTKVPIFFTVTVEDWQNGNEGGSADDFNKIMK